MKQKVKEWKKKKADAKKKKELEKQAQTTTTPTTSDKPSELDTAKTAQPEIEAGMPVYEVKYRKLHLSPFSTRRLFSREATFSFVGVAYHISKCDADKGKSRFARKKSPSGKRALVSQQPLPHFRK